MKVSTSSFLEGVALAAGQAKIGSTASLKRDARKLARNFSQPQFEADGQVVGIVGPIVLANRWLTFRKETPAGMLRPKVIAAPGLKYGGVINMKCHIEGINRAAATFSDRKLAGVLSGTVVGLQTLDLVTPRALDRQWTKFAPEYDRYMATYKTNGVPMEAARELFVREWLDSFSRATSFSFGSGEPRWGSLNVLTVPVAASVFVDDEDWGKSPTGMAVREGDHEVMAKKDELRSNQTVNVAPAHYTEVNLSLG
ncbi:MAG TPA: PEGA domain-containing protein [Pyrinomonadaceae bacterium]